MTFWDWGDDLADPPTYPRRRDGSGSIGDGLRGNDARTSALVEDIKNAFPRHPPLQQVEKCIFEKGDTAYTFMDKTREVFCQVLGPSAGTRAEYRPFILNHYVNHLPASVSQKIKATVGWESFSLDVACTHAAHHLTEMGAEKRDKKDRLLTLQISNLNAQQSGSSGFHQAHIPSVPMAQRGMAGQQQVGFNRVPNYGKRGGGSKTAQLIRRPCPRCGLLGHVARYCVAVIAAPGQMPFPAQVPQQQGMPGQQIQAGCSQQQQVAGGAQGALNAYAPPFYQPSTSNQQNMQAPGHQPQQFRTA